MFNDWLDRSWVVRSSIFILAVCLLSFGWVTMSTAAPKAEELSFWNDSEEDARFTINHSIWDALLKKYVVENHSSGVNRFDFEAVTSDDKSSLDEYLDYLQSMEPRQYPRAEQKAYWLNLFNAVVVQRVLRDTNMDSVKDLGSSLWKKRRLYISMRKVSLNDIMHGILRPIFDDPRVHFSLVAGSIGSASVLPQAFTGANVEELIERNTRDFLSHPRGVVLREDTIVLSTIFKWYQSDFGGDLDGVKKFVEPYVSGILAAALRDARRVDYDYDWSLIKPS